MNLSCNYKVCSFFFVKLFKIRYMLEVVCVKLSTFYYVVRLYIIVEYFYF